MTMHLDLILHASAQLHGDAAQIQAAEQQGYAAVWTPENARNPFFGLSTAASMTQTIDLGSFAARAFDRSPMLTAQIAWDLARQTGGRFVLGLRAGDAMSRQDRHSGSSAQLARLREYVESLRAIWQSFQTEQRLRYRGTFYTFRLMTPFFNPGAMPYPDIPIHLYGASPGICELAGELGQGLQLPPLHTAEYLREQALPALYTGLARSGRKREALSILVPVLHGSGTEASMRQRLALAALEPEARPLLAAQGWAGLADELRVHARVGDWQAAAEALPDALLESFVQGDTGAGLVSQLQARYHELVDRVAIDSRDFDADERRELAAAWHHL